MGDERNSEKFSIFAHRVRGEGRKLILEQWLDVHAYIDRAVKFNEFKVSGILLLFHQIQ